VPPSQSGTDVRRDRNQTSASARASPSTPFSLVSDVVSHSHQPASSGATEAAFGGAFLTAFGAALLVQLRRTPTCSFGRAEIVSAAVVRVELYVPCAALRIAEYALPVQDIGG